MIISRRSAVLSTLFGTGMIGLRSLATGLPASLLLNPRRALADMPAANPKAQYVIFQTSDGGDPWNANVPGMYDDLAGGSTGTSGIAHSSDPMMAATSVTVGNWKGNAALPWVRPYDPSLVPTVPTSTGNVALIAPALWTSTLQRTSFCHLATTTPIHPREPDVLKLMNNTDTNEMLVSILGRILQPQLGTIQSQPVALGASSPAEALSYQGQAQPLIPPLALKATLADPLTAKGQPTPLAALQAIRNDTMNSLYGYYRDAATPAQQDYIDSLVTSQLQAGQIGQSLLAMLDGITSNNVDAQITAAVALIMMKVTPVMTIHIPFGGDNHSDPDLATETRQTTGVGGPNGGYNTTSGLTGVPAIAWLMNQLSANGLSDQVTFASLNVFGRSLSNSSGAGTGRQHNPNSHVCVTIGSGFQGGVIGGVGPQDQSGKACSIGAANCDYGSLAFQSMTGQTSASGDITPADSLPSWGKTLMAGLGIDAATINEEIGTGSVINAALASS
jgi:hypothetical protein